MALDLEDVYNRVNYTMLWTLMMESDDDSWMDSLCAIETNNCPEIQIMALDAQNYCYRTTAKVSIVAYALQYIFCRN